MAPWEKIWLGEQERKYSCGAASLKYALCVLGFSPREDQLRRLARTTWRGTPERQLMAAARRFGVEPKLRHFFEDEWHEARDWLQRELTAGHPVILDVEGFAHYVAAVQTLSGRVVIIDPEGGRMDGDAYARIVLCADRRLKRWWLSGEEDGEVAAFRGLSLTRPTGGHRLVFSEAALTRYLHGRPWVLDEYLVDCVEIASAVKDAGGPLQPLGALMRELGRTWLAASVAHWHGAKASELQMIRAHIEDMAVAAEAMRLEVPGGAVPRVAADMATLLTMMLAAED
jgi:hypothetical protein